MYAAFHPAVNLSQLWLVVVYINIEHTKNDGKELAKIVSTKARWTEEEQVIMAKEESAFIKKLVTQISKTFLSITPDRTLEAIKGRRRSPK